MNSKSTLPLLVLKFTLWLSTPIAVNRFSTFGTRPVKKNSAVYGMATTSKANAVSSCSTSPQESLTKLSLIGTVIWLESVENIPIVLCGNKVDVKERKVRLNKSPSTVRRIFNTTTFLPSAITTFEKPFVWLARKLTGNPNLDLVAAPALAPRSPSRWSPFGGIQAWPWYGHGSTSPWRRWRFVS